MNVSAAYSNFTISRRGRTIGTACVVAVILAILAGLYVLTHLPAQPPDPRVLPRSAPAYVCAHYEVTGRGQLCQ